MIEMTGLKPSKLPINVTKIRQDVFEVTSKNSGSKYVVDIKSQTCTCPHFRFRLDGTGKQCKHLIEACTYIQEINIDNSLLFKNVEQYIRDRYNNADWNEVALKFGDDAIDEMLRLGMLFNRPKARLGVLE